MSVEIDRGKSARPHFAMMPENDASTMTDDGPWLNVPQAVVLEATHDVEFALNLTAENLALLQIKASRRLARSPVI